MEWKVVYANANNEVTGTFTYPSRGQAAASFQGTKAYVIRDRANQLYRVKNTKSK